MLTIFISVSNKINKLSKTDKKIINDYIKSLKQQELTFILPEKTKKYLIRYIESINMDNVTIKYKLIKKDRVPNKYHISTTQTPIDRYIDLTTNTTLILWDNNSVREKINITRAILRNKPFKVFTTEEFSNERSKKRKK